MVRSCGACGSVRGGTGTYEGTHTCKTRGCPTCAWVRAKRVSEWMGKAFDKLDHRGHRWHMVVMTFPYDPDDPEDLSVEGLRSRVQLAARSVKYLWQHELKVPKAGCYRTIEVSVRGHVHANLLYFGPPTNSYVLESVMQTSAHEDLDRIGSIHVQDVAYAPAGKGRRNHATDPRGSREGLERAAKYISKGVCHGGGNSDEEYLSNQCFVRTTDPELVARWEVATYRTQLTQKMGALRGLKLDEDGKKPHEDVDDSDVACGGCGVVGEWGSKVTRAEEYVFDCHTLGIPALVTGNWKERPPDG